MKGPMVTLALAGAVFALAAMAAAAGWVPVGGWIRRRERFFGRALYQLYLPATSPRAVAWASAALVPVLAVLTYLVVDFWVAPIAGGLVGLVLPPVVTGWLIRRRVERLEDQVVSGIQTLASGVRAGLNLVQSFQLLERNAPAPLSQEVGQLLREYEHGLSLEQAMVKTGQRIGSPTYRLLFSALETHRVRGGDLGETLDRIAEAIREIQRLEKRVETLTAEGRAAARLMGIMPFVILGILYLIDRQGVTELFTTTMGRFILLAVAVLIGFGFWWIRKIVDIDI